MPVLPPPGAQQKATGTSGASGTKSRLQQMAAALDRAKKARAALAEQSGQMMHAAVCAAEIQTTLGISSFASGYRRAQGKSLRLGDKVDARLLGAGLAFGYGMLSKGTNTHALAVANGFFGSWLAEKAFDMGVEMAQKAKKDPAATPAATPTTTQGAIGDDGRVPLQLVEGMEQVGEEVGRRGGGHRRRPRVPIRRRPQQQQQQEEEQEETATSTTSTATTTTSGIGEAMMKLIAADEIGVLGLSKAERYQANLKRMKQRIAKAKYFKSIGKEKQAYAQLGAAKVAYNKAVKLASQLGKKKPTLPPELGGKKAAKPKAQDEGYDEEYYEEEDEGAYEDDGSVDGDIDGDDVGDIDGDD